MKTENKLKKNAQMHPKTKNTPSPIKNTCSQQDTIATQSSFPKRLTPEEEIKYINIYENGEAEDKIKAKNILIERNLRLVAHIAKKYRNTDMEDLISIGTIGLIKGIASYNSKKGVKLSTYVSKCIENEILMYLRSTKKYNNEISIQDSLGSDKEGNSSTLEERLPDDIEEIGDMVVLKMQVRFLYDKISEVLTQREKEIIEMRYGLSKSSEKTQREIGEILDISRSYVSRIEKKVLKKLKQECINWEKDTSQKTPL